LACWFWIRFFKNFQCIFALLLLSPLENGYPLRLKKLESHPPKADLFQVWLKLAQKFWRRFLNDATTFLHFCDYLPFENDLALYL
jgi:hypothetical protein